MNVRICEKKLHVLRKKIRRRNIYAFFENEETIITKKNSFRKMGLVQ